MIDLVSRQMKIPTAEIRPDAEFSQYGFDSISLTALATTLKRQWRLNLAPTIFSSMPRSAGLPHTSSANMAACWRPCCPCRKRHRSRRSARHRRYCLYCRGNPMPLRPDRRPAGASARQRPLPLRRRRPSLRTGGRMTTISR
ncbi:acyl carrier protein [Ralstonia solanacearum]